MPFIRPNLPYDNQSLPNDDRFRILTRALDAPPTDIMLDSEFNAVTDGLNVLENSISGIVLVLIPGANNPDNANFVFSTTGSATQWIQVSDINIAPQSINANKLIPQSITNIQIGNGAIFGANISNATITNSKMADSSITTSKIAPFAVTALNIANQTITAIELAPNAITTPKILDANVTTPKLADNAVTTPKLADNAVTTPKILDANVTTPKLADNAVTAGKMANQTITATQIANDTITFAQINNSFTATKAQQQAASSSSVYVSPARQQDHPSAAKAWVLFDGNNGTIQSQYGVASISQIGTGIFRITFATAFTNSNYITSATIENTAQRCGQVDPGFARTTTQMQIRVVDSSSTANTSTFVNCVFYGTQ